MMKINKVFQLSLHTYFHCILMLCVFNTINAKQEILWDLGVMIDKTQDKNITQKEIDLDTFTYSPTTVQEIRALHSNNFIEPILHEIKGSLNHKDNIIKTYDNIINKLSFTEKTALIKKSFLSKEYIKFFSLHKFFKNHKNEETTIFNSMYVQNLYYSHQFDKTLTAINAISKKQLTDELLLYKIKTLIKLKFFSEAKTNIDDFITIYPNSDLIHYINHEKQLINNKHEK